MRFLTRSSLALATLRRRKAPLALTALVVCGTIGCERDPGRERAGQPVGGVVAVLNRSALADAPFPGQFCGGALIGPSTVLTAAHCVARGSPDIDVIVGADNLCAGRPVDGHRLTVRAIHVDPAYDPATGQADIATLELDGSDTDPPLAIGTVTDGARLVAYGWGARSAGGVPSCRLEAVHLTAVATDTCLETITGDRPFDPQTMICATPTARDADTCTGDSGGPVVLADRAILVAVVSWGLGCGSGVPGVYARADRLVAPSPP